MITDQPWGHWPFLREWLVLYPVVLGPLLRTRRTPPGDAPPSGPGRRPAPTGYRRGRADRPTCDRSSSATTSVAPCPAHHWTAAWTSCPSPNPRAAATQCSQPATQRSRPPARPPGPATSAAERPRRPESRTRVCSRVTVARTSSSDAAGIARTYRNTSHISHTPRRVLSSYPLPRGLRIISRPVFHYAQRTAQPIAGLSHQ